MTSDVGELSWEDWEDETKKDVATPSAKTFEEEVESVVSNNRSFLSYSGQNLSALVPINSDSLVEINLSHNLLEGAVELTLLSNIPSLQKLDLSYNKIDSGEFLIEANFPELKVLNLSHNKITSITFLGSVNFPLLEELYLNNNYINDNVDVLINNFGYPLFSEIKIIDLSNNMIPPKFGKVYNRAILYYLRKDFHVSVNSDMPLYPSDEHDEMELRATLPRKIDIEAIRKEEKEHEEKKELAKSDPIIGKCSNLEDPIVGDDLTSESSVIMIKIDEHTIECMLRSSWESMIQTLHEQYYITLPISRIKIDKPRNDYSLLEHDTWEITGQSGLGRDYKIIRPIPRERLL